MSQGEMFSGHVASRTSASLSHKSLDFVLFQAFMWKRPTVSGRSEAFAATENQLNSCPDLVHSNMF